jgi:hypothetical protein
MIGIVTISIIKGLAEIVWDNVEWIKLAGDVVQWLAVMKKVRKLADDFLIFYVHVTVHRNKFPPNKTN